MFHKGPFAIKKSKISSNRQKSVEIKNHDSASIFYQTLGCRPRVLGLVWGCPNLEVMSHFSAKRVDWADSKGGYVRGSSLLYNLN